MTDFESALDDTLAPLAPWSTSSRPLRRSGRRLTPTCWRSSRTLNSGLVFMPLVVGSWSHAPKPVGTMPPKSRRRSTVFSSRHSGKGGHNP